MTRTVSPFIEKQFPAYYQENGPEFVQFVKAYYEWLEKTYPGNEFQNNIDIDKSVSSFLKYFKNTYLKKFPFVSTTDKKFMIKHIMDFYAAKGTPESSALMIKMLFGEESSVYLPQQDILRTSDSVWYVPQYIEVTRENRTSSFVNKEIVGSKSKARAIVEGIVTKRINGKYIDVLYISNVRGFFVRGELVSDDGKISGAPIITGSLTRVTITNGGRNNKIGDIFNVDSLGGAGAKVRVAEVTDATGRVDFNIVDGGSGYTIDDDTKVLVSDTVLSVKNPNFDFIDFEKVYQLKEQISLLATEVIASHLVPGALITGVTSADVETAHGVVLSVNTFESSSNVVTSDVDVLMIDGTFTKQDKLTLSTTTPLMVEETIEGGKTIEMSIGSVTFGSPNIGDRVVVRKKISSPDRKNVLTLASNAGFTQGMRVSQALGITDSVFGIVTEIISTDKVEIKSISSNNPSVTSFQTGITLIGEGLVSSNVVGVVTKAGPAVSVTEGTGYITEINGSNYTMFPSWGVFDIAASVTCYSPSNVVTCRASLQSATETSQASRATVIAKPASNEIIIGDIRGLFSAGDKIRGEKTRVVQTISSVSVSGVTDIFVDGAPSTQVVLDSSENTSAVGMVIGQNSTSIGIYGNEHSFASASSVSIASTKRNIKTVSVNSSNDTQIETTTPHNFEVGQTINLALDIQVLSTNEVKRIYGVYDILGVFGDTVTIRLSNSDTNLLKQSFALFESTLVRTIRVNINTDRRDMISPPRDNLGNIIEVEREVISSSFGNDATFEIGEIENEDTVFLYSDLLKHENIAEVPYMTINIDATGSGIGVLGSIEIVDGGTGYGNGFAIGFNGGGLNGSEPLEKAVAVVETDENGTIVLVTVTDVGAGYYEKPTIDLGSNQSATLVIDDFVQGYGFPKYPTGDLWTPMELLFERGASTIGTISKLEKINPGRNYNVDPFVRVYNEKVAGFQRRDIVVTVEDPAFYNVGEGLVQEFSGGVTAKGIVKAVSGQQVIIKRTTLNVSFREGELLRGQDSQYQSRVIYSSELPFSRFMGDNADISATVIYADGIATVLEVIDSGFGYEHQSDIVMWRENTPYAMSGIAHVENHGKSLGNWRTTNSHLNSEAKIHDNYYYQEFAYEIISGKSLVSYEQTILDVLHTSGNKLFGKVEKRLYADASVGIGETFIGRKTPSTPPEILIRQKLFDGYKTSQVEGEILWNSPEYWFRDQDGIIQVNEPGQIVRSWKPAKTKEVKRRNLLVSTDQF